MRKAKEWKKMISVEIDGTVHTILNRGSEWATSWNPGVPTNQISVEDADCISEQLRAMVILKP